MGVQASGGAPMPGHLARDAADLLWFYLRGRQLADCVFRRRHAIGAQVADFVCLERRLCLIVDAGDSDVVQRAAFIKSRGFTVRRLDFSRVFEDTENVLDEISEVLEHDGQQ